MVCAFSRSAILALIAAAMCRAEDMCQSMCDADKCCCYREDLGGPVCADCAACESATNGKAPSFIQQEQSRDNDPCASKCPAGCNSRADMGKQECAECADCEKKQGALALVQRHVSKHETSKCPSKEKPTLLYNHITKTGGAAVKELLMAAVPLDDWKVEENLEDARLTPQKKDQSFVIGLVRRPCDYLVSWYYQLKSKCETKADETDHLNCNNNGVKSKLAKNILGFVNDTEASTPHRMSVILEERYGKEDNVHCMMRTHNLKADFIDCMGKYQACGGTINNETTLDELADKALRKAAGITHEAGRSVGNHPACADLFDKDLEAQVLTTEQTVVNKYNLETCCSVDKHQ